MKCLNDDIQNDFIKMCNLIKENKDKENYKKMNYYMIKISTIYKNFKENMNNEHRIFLVNLLNNDRNDIRIKAAICLLQCDIEKEIAVQTLEKIAKNSDNKEEKVDAEMCIRTFYLHEF